MEIIKSAVVLLTFTEAAQRLRKTEKQLRWMVHTKTAPKSALIAGRRMFRLADVDAWIDEKFDKEAS